MDEGSIKTLHIDIEENRFGFRTAIYREAENILWRDIKTPGMRGEPVPIDLSVYKKKVFTLTREGCEPVTTVIIKP